MKRLPVVPLSVAFTLSASYYAIADIVKMETNDWSSPRTLTWSGRLQKIDESTQVAFFTYKKGSENKEFQVNITRIYALTLDDQEQVDYDFPTTKQELKTPLPTIPNEKGTIELTNDGFVGDNIPAEVKVRPDRKSARLYLSGTIKYGDLQKMMLEAKAADHATSTFEISRSDLLTWIRGR